MEFDFKCEPGLCLNERNLKTDGEPEVTIVTPFYNGAKYFEQTYNCVINQTFPWFEWIVVNDGSTRQEDVEFAEKIISKDPRVRMVHKENGGISTARNFGIRQAKTKYVAPLDCDDLIEPTWLEYCWWMLEKNSDAAWAYTDSVGFQGQEYLWKEVFDPIRLKTYNHLTAVAVIRKEWFDRVNGYAEISKHFNEDWHLWLRIVGKGGFPVQSCGGDYLFWYRRTDTGVLSIVNDPNSDWSKKNTKFIETAAATIKEPKQPIIYPRSVSDFDTPKVSSWNKCIFTTHNKIHVTIMAPWLEMGGADRFNLDLIKGIDKKKFEISILTTERGVQAWGQKFRNLIPDVLNLANFVELKDFAEFVSYFIKSRQTDILMVTNSYHGYYMIPWLRKNFPNIVIIDYVHMEEWYWRKGGYARTSGIMGSIIEKTYVCNSTTEKVMIKDFKRDPETVKTVHIGVDSERFNEKHVPERAIYKFLGISTDRPIVLFICRLHAQKRPFLMLEIAKALNKKYEKAAFVVVGNGPLEEELKQSCKDMGLTDVVYFAGDTDDPRLYYKDSAVTLICSLKEGLSLTAYESLAMGVPVVSADVGGQCDLVDASVGALIPCMDSESEDFGKSEFSQKEIDAYTDALLKILCDNKLRERMSIAGRKRIEESFSIGTMIKNMESEFEWLMSDPVLKEKRKKMAETLSQLGFIADDMITMEMQENACETWLNEQWKACETRINAMGDVDWMRTRISALENSYSYRFGNFFMRIPYSIIQVIKKGYKQLHKN